MMKWLRPSLLLACCLALEACRTPPKKMAAAESLGSGAAGSGCTCKPTVDRTNGSDAASANAPTLTEVSPVVTAKDAPHDSSPTQVVESIHDSEEARPTDPEMSPRDGGRLTPNAARRDGIALRQAEAESPAPKTSARNVPSPEEASEAKDKIHTAQNGDGRNATSVSTSAIPPSTSETLPTTARHSPNVPQPRTGAAPAAVEQKTLKLPPLQDDKGSHHANQGLPEKSAAIRPDGSAPKPTSPSAAGLAVGAARPLDDQAAAPSVPLPVPSADRPATSQGGPVINLNIPNSALPAGVNGAPTPTALVNDAATRKDNSTTASSLRLTGVTEPGYSPGKDASRRALSIAPGSEGEHAGPASSAPITMPAVGTSRNAVTQNAATPLGIAPLLNDAKAREHWREAQLARRDAEQKAREEEQDRLRHLLYRFLGGNSRAAESP